MYGVEEVKYRQVLPLYTALASTLATPGAEKLVILHLTTPDI
jgi:hypothetical protein